jgi:hypothetical protein
MSEIPIIDVAIGLVFAYVLLSMLCTLLNEWVARIFRLRSNNLTRGLKQLLSDKKGTGLVREVLGHQLIKGSAANQEKQKQSYIASDTFARVLIDIIDKESGGAAKAAKTGKDIKDALEKVSLPDDVKSVITGLIDDADTTINDLRKNLQTWFDSSMERISGWYKRKAQLISLIIAIILTIGFNVNTITVGQSLWQNPVLRTQIADEVAVAIESCKGKGNLEDCSSFREVKKNRDILKKFPIGWPESAAGIPSTGSCFFIKIIGWLITALAVSLGAPFWFDVLDKLNSIRSAGLKPKTGTEKSQ